MKKLSIIAALVLVVFQSWTVMAAPGDPFEDRRDDERFSYFDGKEAEELFDFLPEGTIHYSNANWYYEPRYQYACLKYGQGESYGGPITICEEYSKVDLRYINKSVDDFFVQCTHNVERSNYVCAFYVPISTLPKDFSGDYTKNSKLYDVIGTKKFQSSNGKIKMACELVGHSKVPDCVISLDNP